MHRQLRAIDEQLHRIAFAQQLRVPARVRRGNSQRPQGKQALAVEAEPFTAGRQDPYAVGGQQPVSQRRRRGQDVLAVVEQDQDPPVADALRDCLGWILVGDLPDRHRRGHEGRAAIAVGQRRQM